MRCLSSDRGPRDSRGVIAPPKNGEMIGILTPHALAGAVPAALALAPAAASASTGPPRAHAAAVCADHGTQAQAQRAADTRDGDGDGICCEDLPCPCSTGAGGVNFGARQIARGWAAVYVYGGVPFRQVERFRPAQGRARCGRRGAWAYCGGDFHRPA
jgi:hypothetical protein